MLLTVGTYVYTYRLSIQSMHACTGIPYVGTIHS